MTQDGGADAVRVHVGPWTDAPIRTDGAAEFAVGDVHGQSRQLAAILDAMGGVSAGRGHLTLLGDLIDRGPDSVGALRWATLPAAELGFAGRTILLGNHEIFMHAAMGAGLPAMKAVWLWARNGGKAALAQLGLSSADAFEIPARVEPALRTAIGDAAFEELAAARSHREAGNLLFVHGGVRPGVPLSEWFSAPRLHLESEEHFAWIRDDFLLHEGPHEGGRIVVHGHTPEYRTLHAKGRQPLAGHHVLDGSRLGLDAGSFETGIVAGAEFRDGGYRIYLAVDEQALRGLGR